ncbi:hypothetical protein Mapa_007366 [Marchantia paleacea]|nr:hypothetical protein Mapa_007366 [Marchantia paleacea]
MLFRGLELDLRGNLGSRPSCVFSCGQPMTCLSPLSHSSLAFGISSTPPSLAPTSHTSNLSTQICYAGLSVTHTGGKFTSVSKGLVQLRPSTITSFQDDREMQHQQAGSRKGVPVSKKTQADLLERIAHEGRNKRHGDRESTPVVRALTWAFRQVKVPDDVDALVGGLDLPLPIFTTTVQKLGIEGNPLAALAVFEWLQVTEDKQPNVYTYNSLLGALKANGRWDVAEIVYGKMQGSGVVPDIVTQNTLISMYEQQGAYTYALKLYRSLKPLGLQPSLFTVRNVIQILERKGDVETALDVFGEFKQQCRRLEEGRGKKGSQAVEMKRDAEQKQQLETLVRQMCYERITYLLAHQINREEVIRLWTKIKSKQLQLSRNFYEKLIRACGDGEEDHKFVKLLYMDMRKQQLPISVSLCNHVIQSLGWGKKWWAALEVFEHMVQLGPQPNTYTRKLMLSHFQVLLNSAKSRRIWKWALQLLEKMIQRGVEPDRFSWNAALIACAKAGETDSAVSVFHKMIERGQKPGVVSYGALLSALEKSNHLTGAKMVWKHMQYMGVEPNIVAYTTMISACGRGGSYPEALQLVEEMRAKGIQPSLITYNALITACAKAGDGERALDVIQQMRAAKMQPDAITYSKLIEAMANEGRWEPATAAYKTMQELNLKPPKYAYEAVLRVCEANSIPFDCKTLELNPTS